MDIDMRVYNPKSLVVFEALREGEGKFTIPADADGSYKLCFSNKMSMVSHKTVKLVVDNGEGPDLTGLAKKEHMDSVEQTLITIAHSARMIAFHQEEYRQLHDRHLVSAFLSGGRWACIAVVGWNFGDSRAGAAAPPGRTLLGWPHGLGAGRGVLASLVHTT